MDRQDRDPLEGHESGGEQGSSTVVRRDYLEALITRRQFLKRVAAPAAVGVVAAGGFAGWAYSNSVVFAMSEAPDATGVVLGDATRCGTCRRCEGVCSMVNTGSVRPSVARLSVDKTRNEHLWSDGQFFPETCLQCKDPVPCLSACPTTALQIDRDSGTNARIIVERACAGCRKCEEACPYQMIFFNEDTMKEMKCHLCFGDPYCVKECPTQALTYAPWVDLTGERARRK